MTTLPKFPLQYGKEENLIRVIAAYAAKRAGEIGAENVFNFSIGNPNVPAPARLTEALHEILNTVPAAQLHSYSPAAGLPWVRKAVADDLNARYGTDYAADDLYLTAGASGALAMAFHGLLFEGDEVIVFAPYYPEYIVYAESFGAKVVTIPCREEDFQIDPETLRAALTEKTKIVVVNSPSNPAGSIFSEETIRAMADILREAEARFGHPIYILADEPYRELVYDERITVPFIPKLYHNTIYCYSYSKCVSLPGERMGYLLVPPQVEDSRDVYAALAGAGRILGLVCNSTLFQHLLPHCLDITSDLGIYKTNRDLLLETLTAQGYEMARPDGAFYLFLKAPDGDDLGFCERAKDFELILVPGTCFGYPGYARLSYCVETDTIRRALPAFEKLMETYR